MSNIHYKNLLKLEELQQKYSQYADKIQEKHKHSNLQKAQLHLSTELMNLPFTAYQDKFCLKYTQGDHQAMIAQQQKICQELQNTIQDNDAKITEYLQKLRELNIASQDYNYLLVLSSYAKDILQLRQVIAELKEKISILNTSIAYSKCYAHECGIDDYNEHDLNELKFLEEALDLRRNRLVELLLRFSEEKLPIYSHDFLDSAVHSSMLEHAQA